MASCSAETPGVSNGSSAPMAPPRSLTSQLQIGVPARGHGASASYTRLVVKETVFIGKLARLRGSSKEARSGSVARITCSSCERVSSETSTDAPSASAHAPLRVGTIAMRWQPAACVGMASSCCATICE